MTAAVRTAVVVVALAACGPAGAAPLPNEACPVMPAEKAVPEFHAEHQGRTVYFCCAGCVAKFQANPGAYLANLPPAPAAPPAPKPDAPPGWQDRALSAFLAAAEFCERHQTVLIGVGVASLAIAVAGRAHRRLVRKGSASRWTRVLAAFTHQSAFLVIVLGGACGVLWHETRLAREEVAAAHRAAEQQQTAAQRAQLTDGAKLLKWAWPQGLHELPKGVRNTYYRGNDERSDKLFNGGNYRTATFRVALKRADGSDAEPGARVGGEPLRLWFEITRAPNTAPNFFQADQMAGVFLAPLDRDKEETHLAKPTEAGQKWAVEVPVGAAEGAGYHRVGGVWAVCVGDPKKGVGGATIHYYVQAVLHAQDGVLLPESAVWMVAVYPSPILHGPHADGEWFSDRPIPEIPDGKNVADPKLLGVPEKK